VLFFGHPPTHVCDSLDFFSPTSLSKVFTFPFLFFSFFHLFWNFGLCRLIHILTWVFLFFAFPPPSLLQEADYGPLQCGGRVFSPPHGYFRGGNPIPPPASLLFFFFFFALFFSDVPTLRIYILRSPNLLTPFQDRFFLLVPLGPNTSDLVFKTWRRNGV